MHNALVDIYATIKILNKQLELNPLLPSDAAEIEAYCQEGFSYSYSV